MTELVVVLGLCLCSLSLAAVLGRWLATQRMGAYEVQRLLGAVARAGGDFLKQEGRLLGVSLMLVALAVLTPVVLYRSAAAVPEHVGWTALGLCLGAGAGSLVARAAFVAAVALTSRVVEAVRSDLNDATSAALRGSALIALLTDGVSLLLTLVVLAIAAWYLGQSPGVLASPWVFAAVRLLPAAALGAVAAAAVFQLGGANFHTAAGVASLAARRQDPSLLRERDKNPALVAELVGDYVGAVAARASDYFAALVLANSAMLLVAVWVHGNNPATSGWSLVALPLLVRAVGLIASSLALCNLRFDATQSTWRTLAGAAVSATLVSLVGLFGASLWLVGDEAHLPYFAAGALGLLANSLALGLTYLRLRRDVRRRAEAAAGAEASERDLGSPAARALGQGLQQTWSLMVGVGLCVLGAWLLGSNAALREGGPLALAVMLAGLLSVSAFGLTESLFARVAESARTITTLERSQIDARGRARAQEVDQLGVTLGSLGRTQGIMASAGAAALSAFSLPLLGAITRSATDAGQLAPLAAAARLREATQLHPVTLWGGALGAGCLLFYVGGVLQASTRTANAVAADIVGRLGVGQADMRQAAASVVRLPSYRVSVQLAAATATERLLPLTLAAVLTPLALALALRALYGEGGELVTLQGLMAFAAVATLTGCYAALAAEGAETLLAQLRRRAPERAVHESAGPAAEFIGRCVGPAALLGVKATVVAALVSGPFLFGN